MTAHIIRGNALALPLANDSVDLICTSPPYFGLRSYSDNGVHYHGQLGSEPTPGEFVDALIAATREMVRVLKPSGSIWVNLGDKYAGSPSGPRSGGILHPSGAEKLGSRSARIVSSVRIRTGSEVPNKSLMGIPWRYALRCIDDLGLILRAEIIWAKPNGLPESVTDRVRRSHEQWFHLVKQPRYFSAVDEIREEHVRTERPWELAGRIPESARRRDQSGASSVVGDKEDGKAIRFNPLGKLPGSVWTVPTQPLTVPPELGIDHFAAFPMEWPRRIIQGWSPAGVCTACGEGRRPVSGLGWVYRPPGNPHAEKALARAQRAGLTADDLVTRFGQKMLSGQSSDGSRMDHSASLSAVLGGLLYAEQLRGLLTKTRGGYACGCPEPTAPTMPSTILDPFGGTGTTALVARALGRVGISVDMSADYCRLAAWRCTDPGQMAAALQVEKPEPVSPDQLDLFSEVHA